MFVVSPALLAVSGGTCVLHAVIFGHLAPSSRIKYIWTSLTIYADAFNSIYMKEKCVAILAYIPSTGLLNL
jgi:hypothetical protein